MASDQSACFFWNNDHPQWGFLSNHYVSPFHTDDETKVYKSMEQYFMEQKALLFNDTEIATAIMATSNPRKNKALGRKIKNFDSAVWDQHKVPVVEAGVYYKFINSHATHVDLKAMLLATGDCELVEASPFDRIWGVGYDAANAAENRAHWGENLMGKITERVRQRIRDEEAARSAQTSAA